jgi:hypothetical protein
VAWPKGCGSSADASGASFGFSLRPKVARYGLKLRGDEPAFTSAEDLKMFGFGLQFLGHSGECSSGAESQYGGPRAAGEIIGVNEREYEGIVRLEVWQL